MSSEFLKNALVPENEQPYPLPDGWVWVRLGRVGNVISGFSFKSTEFSENNQINVIKITNVGVNEFCFECKEKLPSTFIYDYSKYLVNENDVLLALTRPYIKNGLKVAVCPFEFNNSLLNQRVAVIKGEQKQFIYYYLTTDSVLEYIKSNCNTTNQPNISINKVFEMPLPLPPLPEQKRIVDKLDSLLGKIKEARTLINEAKESFANRRSAILHKAFTGELTANWRAENPTEDARELLEQINIEKLNKYNEDCQIAQTAGKTKPKKPEIQPVEEMLVRESEQPYKLPDGWVWVRLGSVTTVYSGGTPSTTIPAYFEDGKIPWLTPKDLSGYKDQYISGGSRYITELGLSNSSAKLVPKDSILLTTRAPIGYIAIAANEISTNQGFKSFYPSSACKPHYLYWYLGKSKSFLETFASGTTFLEISAAKVAEIPVPLPPLSEQKEIVSRIEALLKAEDEAKELLDMDEQLDLLEKAVLSKAFRGELDTQDASDEPAVELLKRLGGEVGVKKGKK